MSYTRLDSSDQVVSSEIVVSPAWTFGITNLTSFYTSSNQEQSSTGQFYLNSYNINPTSSDAIVQYSLAYGNLLGSGSAYFSAAVTGSSPTKDIYGQYKALILGDENSKFIFDYISGSNDIAVISVARSCYKQAFNPGSLSLTLTNGGNTVTLTDNSQVQTTATFINNTQYYTLVSGSLGNVYSSTATTSGSYGLVIPDMGLIIINPNALALAAVDGGIGVTWNTSTTSTPSPSPFYNYNNRILQTLISNGGSFQLQSAEVLSSNFLFCRAKNADYNYTSNPTIIDASGSLIYNELIYSPVTYITTVGLYNDSNELLAVAKLSKPLQKDFTKETLVRVKLDY